MKVNLPSDPLWYKDAIIYELHVKAFSDSNHDGIGDFRGLTQKLDYLQDLGITCIWLLPFYPSPLKDDGYDISNYRDVHPSYGTRRDFMLFVKEAHRRGIRVITELVINHTSDQHPWFQAARKAPAGSSKRNFYVWSDTDQKYAQSRIIFKDTEKSNWTWDPVAKAYYWHRFFSHQPDLNFDNPAVRRAIIKVMHFWLELGVDGLRLDAVPYLVEREGTNCENLPETHAVLKEMRREMDAHFKDRMFLAEANQWPADVRPYFGNGDECHMAFHFPLMPRIFMALRQEDRHPITEIIRQTPDIPDSCQWAIFLRNHDELTLEMVTDEERDYMYREYALDVNMRLNLGIRRRLACLLGNSRRRMELLHSLLLSFPGTPIIYYGDEIGMGDNFYLGDRDGVRTPMQWSADRNAGFSRADFAQLYCPPIMDSVYGFQAVNVEAQHRDPSSFLNWMKRMIALSKRFKTFGRGTLEFLNPANRKVLVYVRRYQQDITLFVANLSRFVQPAEIDLSTFEGMTPVEMLGHVEFPKVGKLPYFLTLGPHAFYWFQLQRVAAPQTATTTVAPTRKADEELLSLTLAKGWESLFEGPARQLLETQILPKFLQRQRWYGEKAQTLQGLQILDWSLIKPDVPQGLLCWVQTQYADGLTDTYVLTLGIAWGPGADALRESQPQSIIASVQGPEGPGLLHEGLADDGFCQALLQMVQEGCDIPTQLGRVHASPTAMFSTLRGDPQDTSKIIRQIVEQSNSSVRFGSHLFLKLFRRLQPGLNPDWEIGRYLTEKTTFPYSAKVAGGVEYTPQGQEPRTLAIFQELVENQGSGWDHTLDELSRYFERVQGRPAQQKIVLESNLRWAIQQAAQPVSSPVEKEPVPSVGTGSTLTLTPGQPAPSAAGSEVPQVVVDTLDTYLHFASTLGERTAQLHLALSQNVQDPAFEPERLSPDDAARLSAALQLRVPKAFKTLQDRFSALTKPTRTLAERVLAEQRAILQRVAVVPSVDLPQGKIRCHGDYHLGQVLWTNNDFVILDFEGEPVRPLSERRAKQSPLRDVSGMIRSFNYAAYTGLGRFTADRPQDVDRLKPWTKFWDVWSSSAFLKQYCRVVAGKGFLPRDPGPLEKLLDLFLWEKVLYELLYELNNRPAWVHIPLEGMLSLLEPAPQTDPGSLLQLADKS